MAVTRATASGGGMWLSAKRFWLVRQIARTPLRCVFTYYLMHWIKDGYGDVFFADVYEPWVTLLACHLHRWRRRGRTGRPRQYTCTRQRHLHSWGSAAAAEIKVQPPPTVHHRLNLLLLQAALTRQFDSPVCSAEGAHKQCGSKMK